MLSGHSSGQSDGDGDEDYSLSAALSRIASRPDRDRIHIRDLLAELVQRAIAAMLFVFAVPNTIPVPPGVSGVLGAPLLFLAAQLMLGRPPWLPGIIADRSFDRTDFERILHKVGPWLQKAERLMRPRLTILTRPPLENVIGAIVLLLSIVLFLPIPLGNMLPAIAICILALGSLQRDGLWIIFGTVTAIVSMIIVSGVIAAFAYAGWLAIGALLNG
jgi:hypothetical protein